MFMQQPAGGQDSRKGGSHVVDHSGNTDYSVVIGTGEQLHARRIYPYSACHCDYCCDCRIYFRTKGLTVATRWKLAHGIPGP
jgi:hypothetical protein